MVRAQVPPLRSLPIPTPRPRAAAAALAALVLLATGCAIPGDSGTDEEPQADTTASDQTTASSPGPTGAAEDATGPTPGGAPDFSDPTDVATDLEAPWSIAFHGRTALVSERDSGRVIALDDSGQTREVTTIDEVAPRGEGGLLGLAVHDDHLYAYYTTASDNRVVRFPLTGSPGDLGVGAPETVLDGIPAAGNHNGGRIAFGPDDMLYVTTGDAGDGSSAQDQDSPAGKILRVTPDGGVPDDNPFADSPVFSLGHRNPQGLDWTDDGTLYASEFGQDTWDELNVIEPGGNYGWPDVEGIGGDDEFIDPVQQWDPADASPSGLAVVGDSVVIANLRGERVWEVPVDDPEQSTDHLAGDHGRLRAVTEAPDGSLWILTNNTDGRGDPAEGDDRILRVPVE
ncbi:PQQ-dependent sugar dehydrogenase [Brevibacterium jeotgali]|uniref:Glucose/arabinose dehydrogenase, beta-propeller fold n=1 Tax=Brevibacterium jeotgali TaxID=1262550 RepID=A0A2H1L4R9_9MICO|nr:PQQ-dependent sugar dehydrogenase [Brevibacterium jeotgali]TWB98639.1 glucose/arabinose dehydrogenase [Brevibacterium jeotgali]SMY11760.1 Glucose/arabinose dehydrogenase, beta-propeller fold [Brevibacterium jeotgali]